MNKNSKSQIQYRKRFNEIVKKLHGIQNSVSDEQSKKEETTLNSKKKGVKIKFNDHSKNLKDISLLKNKTIRIEKSLVHSDFDTKSNKIEMHLHKFFDSYLGKINILTKNCINSYNHLSIENIPKMIIILDVSGSMIGQVQRFVRTIIPQILNNLYGSYNNYSVCLITFSNLFDVNIYEGDSKQISQLNINAEGATYMSQAVDKIYEMILNKKYKNRIFRILTVSDGELHDQENTMHSSDQLKELLQKEDLIINSQSIRLFTGFDEPDTRGLSSILQLSTIGKQMLIDVDSNLKDEEISKLISDLFINDGLGDSAILESKLNKNCLQEEPWLPSKKSIYIFPGINTFWINLEASKDDICKEIENNFVINYKNGDKASIKCLISDEISIKNYQDLIKDKIDFYFKQLKVLKIVNTEESLNKMDKIIEFFNNLENNIFSKNFSTKSLNEFKLYERTQSLISLVLRRKISITNKMREIKNDDKINQLNARQLAEYLREMDINDKTGKSLAKRALCGGIDFDDIIREEVKQIANHINELDSVDESKLTSSYYSTCNILDGIKAVCRFYHESIKNNVFKEVNANDIIKLINIVGVAANSIIGNYPDPMTYRVKALYPGTFISLSDILIAYEVNGGQHLKEIGTQNEINTTVPYFEDEKIEKFLIIIFVLLLTTFKF